MNPLARGFYTAKEAAQLIEVGNVRRIHGWLSGYKNSDIGPLLERDYSRVGRIQELSFYDLMEVKFVEYFRENGVRVQTLRAALATAREVFGLQKPLASNKVRFIPSKDGKMILVDESDRVVATKDEDPHLWNLVNRQYEHYELIHDQIERGVEFDATSHLAKTWRPRPRTHPDIVIDPLRAYGKPIVSTGTPTSVIYEAWLAEGRNPVPVTEWFELTPSDVQSAIEFEVEIRGARNSVAA